jgi:hypothetical protein
MQPKQPCSLCRLGFREKALVAYHAWFNGENRLAYKQRMCIRCWREHFSKLVVASTDQNDYSGVEPVDCAACGHVLGNDAETTWTTWFRGQQRKDIYIVHCPQCAIQVRMTMMVGADRQPERPLAGVREGGAPLPNPQGFGSGDLPW